MRLRTSSCSIACACARGSVQELFAVLGIAVGVALLFASQIAGTSLNGSVRQLVSGVVGTMRFQLAARGPQGFDQSVLRNVQRIPGVQAGDPGVPGARQI